MYSLVLDTPETLHILELGGLHVRVLRSLELQNGRELNQQVANERACLKHPQRGYPPEISYVINQELKEGL